MNLTYALMVNGSNYGSQSSQQAFQFAKTLIKERKHLKTVFFYQDGVLNASRFNLPANDEVAMTKEWQQLSQEYGVELEMCIASALRRGVIGEEEVKAYRLDVQPNLVPDFKPTGLGSFATMLLTYDRVIQF